MAKMSVMSAVMPAACVALLCFAMCAVNAQDALEPMAGTGGVMRDAERRALPTVKPKEDAKVPELKASVQKGDVKEDAANGKMLGVIEEIVIFGAKEFAERESVADRIAERLCDGTPKTEAQVKDALSQTRYDLMTNGFYLARFFLMPNSYDAKKKTYSVKVDDGKFGKLDVRFEKGKSGGGTETNVVETAEADNSEGTWFSRNQIMKRFRLIQENETFDYSLLRGALFEANSHPDITIDTKIDVNRKPFEGEDNDRRIVRYADLDLTVHESFPLHGVWEVNNFGMEDVEEWQSSLTLQYLNLTKHDDVLTLSPSMSFGAELMSLAGSYMLPHTYWRGGNTTLYGGWSRLDVDDIIPSLDLEGSGWFVGLQHSENLYDTDRHLFAVSGGLLWRYIEDQYTVRNLDIGGSLASRDVTVLPASLAFSYTGKKADFLGGRNFATVQGVFNVCSTGDELDEMWTDAEENYWIFRWQLARLQPIFGTEDTDKNKYLHQWMLFSKLEGQYTDDVLIPTEKLSLGGYNTMRGYRTRGYIGDYGVYGTFELRTPILVDALSSLFGYRSETPFDRLQGLVFTDYGWTAFNDLPAGYDDNEFLFSAGAGVRAALTKYSQLRCDVAFPLANAYGDDDNMEVYLSAQLQF